MGQRQESYRMEPPSLIDDSLVAIPVTGTAKTACMLSPLT